MSSQNSRPEDNSFDIPPHAPTRHIRRRPGDRNFTGRGFDLHPEVFLVSGGLILLFVLFTLIFKEPAENAFGAIQTFISGAMGWFLILSVSVFLIFGVYIALSKLGNVRLGLIPPQFVCEDLINGLRPLREEAINKLRIQS
ncbi:MAG: BCCT family transporter [Leptolyngbyaceae cyanobacterium]